MGKSSAPGFLNLASPQKTGDPAFAEDFLGAFCCEPAAPGALHLQMLEPSSCLRWCCFCGGSVFLAVKKWEGRSKELVEKSGRGGRVTIVRVCLSLLVS